MNETSIFNSSFASTDGVVTHTSFDNIASPFATQSREIETIQESLPPSLSLSQLSDPLDINNNSWSISVSPPSSPPSSSFSFLDRSSGPSKSPTPLSSTHKAEANSRQSLSLLPPRSSTSQSTKQSSSSFVGDSRHNSSLRMHDSFGTLSNHIPVNAPPAHPRRHARTASHGIVADIKQQKQEQQQPQPQQSPGRPKLQRFNSSSLIELSNRDYNRQQLELIEVGFEQILQRSTIGRGGAATLSGFGLSNSTSTTTNINQNITNNNSSRTGSGRIGGRTSTPKVVYHHRRSVSMTMDPELGIGSYHGVPDDKNNNIIFARPKRKTTHHRYSAARSPVACKDNPGFFTINGAHNSKVSLDHITNHSPIPDEYTALENYCQQLEAQLIQREQDILQATEFGQLLLSQNKQYQNERDAYLEKNDELRNQCHELEQQLNRARKSQQEHQTRYDDLKQEYEELTTRHNQVIAQRNDAQNQLWSVLETLKQKDKQIDELTEQAGNNEALKRKISALLSQIEELKKRCNEQKEALKQLQEEKETLLQQEHALKDKTRTLQADLKNAQDLCTQLQEQIQMQQQDAIRNIAQQSPHLKRQVQHVREVVEEGNQWKQEALLLREEKRQLETIYTEKCIKLQHLQSMLNGNNNSPYIDTYTAVTPASAYTPPKASFSEELEQAILGKNHKRGGNNDDDDFAGNAEQKQLQFNNIDEEDKDTFASATATTNGDRNNDSINASRSCNTSTPSSGATNRIESRITDEHLQMEHNNTEDHGNHNATPSTAPLSEDLFYGSTPMSMHYSGLYDDEPPFLASWEDANIYESKLLRSEILISKLREQVQQLKDIVMSTSGLVAAKGTPLSSSNATNMSAILPHSPAPTSYGEGQQEEDVVDRMILEPTIMEEHFKMLCISVKMLLSKEEQYQQHLEHIWAMRSSELYLKALKDEVLMHEWFSWILDQFEQSIQVLEAD